MSDITEDNPQNDNEQTSTNKPEADGLLEHYDFSDGEQGRYQRFWGQPYVSYEHHPDGTVTTTTHEPVELLYLDPDVRAYFPDAASVNRALRGLIALIPDGIHDASMSEENHSK